MPTLIGICADTDERGYRIGFDYVRSVRQAGGTPGVLPPTAEGGRDMLSGLSGLLLTGGPDVDPRHYDHLPRPELGGIDPERDAGELALTCEALSLGIPILAICRGIQVLTVALGGTLIQDIPSEWPSAIAHVQRAPRGYPFHTVAIRPGTRLHGIMGTAEIRVNSFHHQAVSTLPDRLVPTGHAPDGLIEAVEDPAHAFCVGVQWHPENLAATGDRHAQLLFGAFCEAAARFRAVAV